MKAADALGRREFCAGLAAATLASARTLAFAATPQGMPATGRTGKAVLLPSGDVQDLRRGMKGRLVAAGDEGYDKARAVWNGAFDRRPALVASCASPADVALAVGFARTHDLLLAVRGGGHSLSGQSTCDGGLVVDLSPMRGVEVDATRRVARVEGGVLLGELDRKCQAAGLATPAGRISHTGAAGLTLGGGFGRLTRRFGLACDNLVGADVIVADGRRVRAGPDGDAGLLWGLKGGGGNFGAVTAFEYRLHPVTPEMYGGVIVFPLEQARQVLEGWVDVMMTAPDELFADISLGAAPNGDGVMLEVCYSGPVERAAAAVAPLRRLGKPLLDALRPATYVQLQSDGDAAAAHGQGYYERSGFVVDVPQALVDAVVDCVQGPRPAGTRILLTGECGGAFNRVAPDATAFWNRDARTTVLVQGGWADPRDQAAAEVQMQWARDAFQRLEPYTKGFYVNALATEDATQRIRNTYGRNFDRLVALKRQYDPGNLFQRNANIPPSAAA